MELTTENGILKAGGVFKLVAVGYLIGSCVLFVPLFILVGVLASAINLQAGGSALNVLLQFIPIVLAPIILAMQSIVLGGLTALGVWLYQKRSPIRLVEG